jgi:hypothetical protein
MRYTKVNGGKGAILCNGCHTIVKEDFNNPDPDRRITDEDWESDKPIFCTRCEEKQKQRAMG